MAERRLVALFGDSLLMDAIEANLATRPDLGVVRVRTAIHNFEQRLFSLSPDLVIFDLDTPHSEFVIPFLRQRPGLSLIGLDATTSRVLALSSQQFSALTMDDLAAVIQMQTNGRGQVDTVA